jgi:hypothetical protein
LTFCGSAAQGPRGAGRLVDHSQGKLVGGEVSGVTEIGTPEIVAIQVGATEIGILEERALERGVPRIGAGEIGVLQVDTVQLDPGDDSSVQVEAETLELQSLADRRAHLRAPKWSVTIAMIVFMSTGGSVSPAAAWRFLT